MTQQCPRCETALPEEDRFCEVCGAALPERATAQGPECPKCHAGAAEIDHEGFCCACGFRREERGRDHFECILAPHFAGVSDRGLRHHRNEDYLVLKSIGASALLIVCDGVSSVYDPDVASAVAAERTSLALEEFLGDDRPIGPEEMQAALAAAQNSVTAIPRGREDAAPSDDELPATTIVAAAVRGQKAVIGWRGDSRAYWIDTASITQLTADHSWCADVIGAGTMTESEAHASPRAHAITQWLGADAPEPALPALTEFAIPGPGTLLLCSDGLWNYAPRESDMKDLLKSFGEWDAISLCRGLVEFARAKGGNDNITVAVLTVGTTPHPDDANPV